MNVHDVLLCFQTYFFTDADDAEYSKKTSKYMYIFIPVESIFHILMIVSIGGKKCQERDSSSFVSVCVHVIKMI